MRFCGGFHSLGRLLLCILSVESSGKTLRDLLFLISLLISFVRWRMFECFFSL